LALVLAAGCATSPPPPEAPEEPPPLPYAWYAGRANVYSVVPERSKVLLYVHREGPLSGLGHNHVIRVSDLAGLVYLSDDLVRARADLAFSVTALELDPPGERAAAGPDFSSKLSQSDLRATRENMLGPDALDAIDHPFIHIRIRPIAREGNSLKVLAEVTLRGVTHASEEIAEITLGAGLIELEGTLNVRQSDFGITPFSILGGAIRVRNVVLIRYRIHALLTSDS